MKNKIAPGNAGEFVEEANITIRLITITYIRTGILSLPKEFWIYRKYDKPNKSKNTAKIHEGLLPISKKPKI